DRIRRLAARRSRIAAQEPSDHARRVVGGKAQAGRSRGYRYGDRCPERGRTTRHAAFRRQAVGARYVRRRVRNHAAPSAPPAPAGGGLTMPRMSMIEAIRDAIDVSMGRDDNVVIFGEDVGYFGGVFRCPQGLQQKYGKERAFDTPISELGIVGTAIGMAAYGLRPCVEVQF